MLESLFGSIYRERVLIFILCRDEAYATEIARFYDVNVYTIQNQLERLEMGGILVSRMVGRTRIYVFNPRYAFLKEIKALLEKVLLFYPEDEVERLTMNRRRPRRRGKPL